MDGICQEKMPLSTLLDSAQGTAQKSLELLDYTCRLVDQLVGSAPVDVTKAAETRPVVEEEKPPTIVALERALNDTRHNLNVIRQSLERLRST